MPQALTDRAYAIRRRTWRVVIVALEIVLLAVIGEAAFRKTVGWRNYFSASHRTIRLSEHLPFEDRTLAPRTSQDVAVRVRADADGFLIPDGADNQRPVDLTIAFMGGSTTESLWVSEDRRWPLVAGREVGRLLGANVSAINAGISGSNLQLTINIFFNKILRRRPDIVVVTETWNDCGLLASRGNYDDWTVESSEQTPLRAMYELASAQSAVIGYLRDWWAARQIDGDLRARLSARGKAIAASVAKAPAEHVAQQYDTRLALLIGAIRAAHAEPVVMTEPAANGGRNGATPDPNWIADCAAFNDRARTIAVRTGTAFIDLASRITDPSYFFDAMHYNDRGSTIAGMAVGQALKDIASSRRRPSVAP